MKRNHPEERTRLLRLLKCDQMRACLLLLAVLSAGCAGVQPPAHGQAVELASVAPEAVVLPEPRATITLPRPVSAEEASMPVSADEKTVPVAKPLPATDKPKPTAATPTPVAIASPSKPSPAPVAAPAPAAPLDLDALRARLRETAAIGLMAKIELRSQVDALVERFRAHHAGGQPSAIDALRQSFNALVQRVLALIREGDPALAAMLASSREAIWGVLEDPVKFNAAK